MSLLRVVASEELTDSWVRGWSLPILAGIAGVLSASALAMAYTTQNNLLDAKEGLNVLVKLTLGAGVALSVFAAADSISGERDRASLEQLLLTPIRGSVLVFGKLIAAWSWWLAVFVVSLPYLWVLGTGLGIRSRAVVASMVVGLIFAALGGALASLFSVRARTNATSIGASILVLLLLAAPGQIPGAVMRGPIGTAVRAVDPITAGLEVLDRLLISEARLGAVVPWLIGPIAWMLIVGYLVFRVSSQIPLEPGA